MDAQLTLRLPDTLAEKLARSAKRMKRKRSDVARLALEQFLDNEPEVKAADRVRDLLGSVESGVPDLGQRHRDYLIERLRRGK
jgi:metal-responsive CopG/Arc/MetJ family transcriptional regulator